MIEKEKRGEILLHLKNKSIVFKCACINFFAFNNFQNVHWHGKVHSALTTVLVVVMVMEVMEMLVDDQVTDKEEVCGGRRHKKKGKTMSIVVSNRKLENSALACRMQMHCTAAKAPSLADKDQTE